MWACRIRGGFCGFALAAGFSPLAIGQLLFHVTPLADLPGGTQYAYAADLNNAGVAVGSSSGASGNTAAVRWLSPTNVQAIGPANGEIFSTARALSDAGHVAGNLSITGGGGGAFVWTAGGGHEFLGALPGGGSSTVPFAVNVLGFVTGYSGNEAFVWSRQGGMTGLGFLPGGGTSSAAYAMNDLGQIGGSATDSGGIRAVIWDSNGIHALPNPPDGEGRATAVVDINESGQCIGNVVTPSTNSPFRWDPLDGYMLLPTLSECGLSYATAINDAGQVIGNSDERGDSCKPWMWDPQRGIIALPDRLDPCDPASQAGVLRGVSAINNDGWITADLVQGQPIAALLTPYFAADPNLDGDTDLSDLTLLLGHFGSVGGVTFAEGDVDEDGSVDLSDLTLLLSRFGATCGS